MQYKPASPHPSPLQVGRCRRRKKAPCGGGWRVSDWRRVRAARNLMFPMATNYSSVSRSADTFPHKGRPLQGIALSTDGKMFLNFRIKFVGGCPRYARATPTAGEGRCET